MGDKMMTAQIEVSQSISTETGTVYRCLSTWTRELAFLYSHTIHHYSLIAIATRSLGVFIHEDFGVAPSTLKHRMVAGQ